MLREKKIMKVLCKSLFVIFCFQFPSCMKDNMRPIHDFNKKGEGVFIVCEGNFMYGNSSLSYYDKNGKSVENQVFLKANGIPLGDVAQSLVILDSTAYIAVNNDGKIYAININTFKLKSKITNLVSPRYIQFINYSKGYITDLYSKNITIFNPKNMTVTGQIDIAVASETYYRHSSEQMVFCNDFMFVNSWSYDDKILVINTKTDKLTDTIQVLKQPRKILLDRNKKLWVLCDGGYKNSPYAGKSGIVRINTATFEIEKIFEFTEGSSPIDMKINNNGDTIYYINNNVYRFQINAETLPTQEYITAGTKNFYALGIDPDNSDLYISDAIDYMQSGVVYRYNSDKVCIDRFNVGVIPNSFVFK